MVCIVGDPLPVGNDWLANPAVPHDIIQEAVSPMRKICLACWTAKQLYIVIVLLGSYNSIGVAVHLHQA